VFTVHDVWPASAHQFAVAWPTVTGRMYRVEHTGQPGDDALYSTLLEVRGNGQVVEAVLPRTEGDSAQYRVTAYMESEPE
jgi:hypothetical protein